MFTVWKLYYTNQSTFEVLTPVGIYLLKVNHRNTRLTCETRSKFSKKDTTMTSTRIVLMPLLLTSKRFNPYCFWSIAYFEQVNFAWLHAECLSLPVKIG